MDDGKEEETVAAVIGKYLGRLPLSKLKIVIGANIVCLRVECKFLHQILSLKNMFLSQIGIAS